jgi:putative ABC transport system permease protein
MSMLEVFRVAIRALLRNKTRSVLTALGIIIGVAAVIAMVAIGAGARASVEETFASMGTNMLIIMPGTTNQGGAHGGFGSMPTLTWDDMRAIKNEISSVRYVAPLLRTGTQILSEEQNWTTQIIGTTAEYFSIRTWDAAVGHSFTDSDVESGAKVIVLGKTVSDKLFGENTDPTGQTVRIKSTPFVVLGVLEAKGQSPWGQDFDDTVFVPRSTYESKIQGGLGAYINGIIMVSTMSSEDTTKAQALISDLLRERHRLPQGIESDFSIRNLTEFASAQEQGTRVLTALLASIAAVSLVVGGIGIMNIMLVSVTERTREIGVRMALGATGGDILLQFLIEALTLSLAGGLIGVGLGLFAASKLAESFHWPMLVSPQIVVLAVAFSALVGVGFGMYPARKASRLDPIEALRYE